MFNGERDRHLDQSDGAQMVRLLVPGRVRRHVGQDKVNRSTQPFQQGRNIFRLIHIAFNDMRAFNRLHRQEVNARHFQRALLQRDLHPPAGRTAQVNNALTLAQQVQLFIYLKQFVGRAGPIALFLGLAHIGILQLAFDPAFGTFIFRTMRRDLALGHLATGRVLAFLAGAFPAALSIIRHCRPPLPNGFEACCRLRAVYARLCDDAARASGHTSC